MVVGFCRFGVQRDYESTVSTAFARKPWLTVYRAHSGFWRIFGFSEFLGSSPDFCLPIGEIIRNTQVRLLNAWVTALELNRGHISLAICAPRGGRCLFVDFSDFRIYRV